MYFFHLSFIRGDEFTSHGVGEFSGDQDKVQFFRLDLRRLVFQNLSRLRIKLTASASTGLRWL